MQPMQSPVFDRPPSDSHMALIAVGLVSGSLLAICSIGGFVFSGLVSMLFSPDVSPNLPLARIFSLKFLA